MVAQAVDRAKANGTAYLVSAGNRARQSWEGVFTPGAVVTAENDFDPSAAEDRRQTIATVPNGQQLSIFVQWDDPVGALTNDFALDFYNANTSAFIGTINSSVATGVPAEGATLNGGAGGTTFAMAIRRVSGTGTPHLKWIANGSFTGSLPAEYPGTSGAIDPDAVVRARRDHGRRRETQRRRPEHTLSRSARADRRSPATSTRTATGSPRRMCA